MRSSRALVVLLVLVSAHVLAPDPVHAQFENYTWYFGEGLGLDFSTDPPTVLRDGRTNSYEGSASISDPNSGKLLFYTDGITVWDRSHQPMPNGFDLASHLSSTQPAVIVPDPGNAARYYIFTADQSGYAGQPRGINYSVVDMRRNAGLGDVVVKNTPLLGNASEKITAVKLCNGSAYWVIAHEFFSNRFFAWKVDANGVELPVVSDVGSIHGAGSGDGIGWMSASPDGTKLALAFFERSQQDGNVELFRFNTETGEVTTPILLRRSLQPYGISFSPSGNKVFVTSVGHLDQFDVSNWDAASMYNSWEVLTSVSKENGAIKLGPDSKLYVQHSNYMGVISSPELSGFRCQYVENSLPMNSQIQWGLPNNIDAHSLAICGAPEAHIKTFISPICEGECVNFSDSSRFGATAWKWEFEGAQPSSSLQKDPTNVCYSSEGMYKVQLTVSNAAGSSTEVKYIKVQKCLPPEVSLRDTMICVSKCVVFVDTSSVKYTSKWECEGTTPSTFDGKTTPPLCYDKPGSYKVRLIASNSFGSDTAIASVRVKECPWPVALSEHDTVVCVKTRVMFTDRSSNDPVQWEWSFEGGQPATAFTKDAGPIVYDEPGTYIVRHIAVNSNGADTAFTTVRVTRCDPPVATLKDREICQGECIDLADLSANDPTSWRWTLDGPIERTFDVRDPGEICFTAPGVYELRLDVANAYGESYALSTITVRSSAGWSDNTISIPNPISVCSSIDTFITIFSGCAPLELANVSSSDPSVALPNIFQTLRSYDSLRIPLTVSPVAVGSTNAVISLVLGDQLLTVPISYVGSADDERFLFGEFDNRFTARACDPAIHEMTITNDACAEQGIASISIDPPNVGFSLTVPDLNIVIPPQGSLIIGVSYDASVLAAADAELIIRTFAGEEQRIDLHGDRALPASGTLLLRTTGSTALEPNEPVAIRLSFNEAIVSELAPEVIELRFAYDADVISVSGITPHDGWSLETTVEDRNGSSIRLRRSKGEIARDAGLADMAFRSFVAARSTSELTLESVVCEPEDPDFEQCVFNLQSAAGANVVVLPICGTDEMRTQLAGENILRVEVNPHPVRSGNMLAFKLWTGSSELIGQPLFVTLIDLQGRRTTLRAGICKAVDQSFELPLTGSSSGVYVLHVQVGDAITATTLVIQ